MAYRLSPPTLDIILAPLAEKERERKREMGGGSEEKRPYRDKQRGRRRESAKERER